MLCFVCFPNLCGDMLTMCFASPASSSMWWVGGMSFRFVDSRPAQPSPRATLVGKLPRCLSYVSYFVVTFVVFATGWKAPVLELPHFPTINQRRKRCIYKVRSFREFEFNKLIRGSCFFFVCEGVVSLSFLLGKRRGGV